MSKTSPRSVPVVGPVRVSGRHLGPSLSLNSHPRFLAPPVPKCKMKVENEERLVDDSSSQVGTRLSFLHPQISGTEGPVLRGHSSTRGTFPPEMRYISVLYHKSLSVSHPNLRSRRRVKVHWPWLVERAGETLYKGLTI